MGIHKLLGYGCLFCGLEIIAHSPAEWWIHVLAGIYVATGIEAITRRKEGECAMDKQEATRLGLMAIRLAKTEVGEFADIVCNIGEMLLELGRDGEPDEQTDAACKEGDSSEHTE
jgi:hypothetical protein